MHMKAFIAFSFVMRTSRKSSWTDVGPPWLSITRTPTMRSVSPSFRPSCHFACALYIRCRKLPGPASSRTANPFVASKRSNFPNCEPTKLPVMRPSLLSFLCGSFRRAAASARSSCASSASGVSAAPFSKASAAELYRACNFRARPSRMYPLTYDGSIVTASSASCAALTESPSFSYAAERLPRMRDRLSPSGCARSAAV
mmetsp:Transcript_10617/g.34859  ORF Transcript_10617/g.34859 Transcript_10617/m.34859 type:complete len:200 (-) Transcript_10617:516-1115(-)